METSGNKEVEEILDDQTEVTNVETTNNDETKEEVVEETQEEFDPDKMFNEEIDLYKDVNGYDLTNFKEQLNLEDQENYELISNYAKTLKDKGFTQEQVEWLINENFVEEENKPNKLTAEQIKKNLSDNLTSEEKRNYNAINNYLNDALKGTELETFRTEIMSNPNLVKLVNVLYKGSLNKTGNINSNTQKRSEKTISSLSFDDARETLMNAIQKGEDKTSIAKELLSKVNDKETFSQFAKVVGVNLN